MTRGVLNTLNTRLDAAVIAFSLDHAETKVVIIDREFSQVMKEALALAKVKPLVIDYDDPEYSGAGERIGDIEYEDFIAQGEPDFAWPMPADEWDAISLNYTSGTTGDPKGVVYHHRGAYLLAVGNIVTCAMGKHPVYLWTLPMFHCNGWCFPWSISVVAGTHVCLRAVRAAAMYDAIADAQGDASVRRADRDGDAAQCAGGREKAAAACRRILHCRRAAAGSGARRHEGGRLQRHASLRPDRELRAGRGQRLARRMGRACRPPSRRRRRRARACATARSRRSTCSTPRRWRPLRATAQTIGEVMFRGNVVMKGYLKNKAATEKAFAGGWFHSGDLGVMHPDGYIQLKDRSKDIIISGGENISSIEVEDALYKHPAVAAAAVVAKPDDEMGRDAVRLRRAKARRESDHRRTDAMVQEASRLLQMPARMVFAELPKTSTGKIQKFKLREMAKAF